MFHASFRTYEDAPEKRSDECGSLIVQIVPAWSRNVYRGVRVDEFVHACPTSQRNCASLATNHCPACTGNPVLIMPTQMTLNEVTTRSQHIQPGTVHCVNDQTQARSSKRRIHGLGYYS
jgi:hypothetical protein